MSRQDSEKNGSNDQADFDILIEWSDEPAGVVKASTTRVSSREHEKTQAAIDRAMKTMQAMAYRVSETMSGIARGARPDEAEVEFGINFSAEAGALIAKAKTEAQISVKLSWTIDEPEEAPDILVD